jgi:hypothetical protein
MIVLDASSTMNESFHGQSKWEVALNSLNVIINGLNPYAKYGLVVIGGSDSSGLGDPCGDPSTPAIAFSTREAVWSHIIQLQPKGGGSFSTAFTLAKTQLQGLSRDKIGTLIFITGSEDACRGGDVWIDLGKIVPDLDTIRLRSEIIILDEDGLKTQTLADQINSLSENINVQAPQSVQELREITNVIVINNVTKYINIEMAARATEGPRPATSISFATNTIAPVVTVIGPPPTPTAIPPTPIPPTAIPPTPIPQPTSTPSPSVVLLSASYVGSGEGCSAVINFQVEGSPATGQFRVWNQWYTENGLPYDANYPVVTLPVGPNGYQVGLGGNGNPNYYRHKVWFEYNGTSSNVLEDLVCPGLTAPP